ncbi:hypothetical protein KIL84_002362, partial [Mauremys mutica]
MQRNETETATSINEHMMAAELCVSFSWRFSCSSAAAVSSENHRDFQFHRKTQLKACLSFPPFPAYCLTKCRTGRDFPGSVAAVTLTQPGSARAEPGSSITLDCVV